MHEPDSPPSPDRPARPRTLGIAVVGLGGAVATTAVAGVARMRSGDPEASLGLPLAHRDDLDLVPYTDLVFGGWDLDGRDLAQAAAEHGVLRPDQLAACHAPLAAIVPWPAVHDARFAPDVGTTATPPDPRPLRARAEAVVEDLKRFRAESGADEVVVVHLGSTEHQVDPELPIYRDLASFESAMDADDPGIGPAMLYAWAALRAGCPHANFTPSVATDLPALQQLARECGLPVAGKDGKTGQTLIKTVLAPALKARGLRIDGWYSTNLLGNRDGRTLADPESNESKIRTKGSVLDEMLGYAVEDHIIQISFYRPRGDDKEAWDNIDFTGFLGHRMQMKVNFLCKDSILAAPLVLEIARCLEFAKRRGESGVLEPLSVFFKAPLTTEGRRPVHAAAAQERMLELWLGSGD